MSSTQRASTIKVHRFGWFGIGVAVALAITGVVFGMRASAAPSTDETTFVPIAPCRLIDTRSDPSLNIGPRNTPLAANDTFVAQVTGTNGHCTVPAAATGISLNVTAVGPTASSFMTIFPSDVTRPVASDLNYVGGAAAIPNKVDVKLSADGKVSFYNLNGSVDLVADVVGYYTHQGIQDILAQLAAKANAADVYTKTDVDAAVATKANAADVYTKTDVDAAVATKANAADVYTKANIDLALLRRQMFVGRVSTSGIKAGSGSYTSSTSGTGTYSVTYDFTGQNIPSSLAPMVIVASPSNACPSGSAMADWAGFGSFNGFLTNMSFSIRTSSAGALFDCGFSFIATFLGSDTIAIPVPSVAASGGATPAVAAAGTGNVVCVNDKGTAVCS